MLETRLGLMTSEEVEHRLSRTDPTAVLVTGSCEQHGPHLPLDTDAFLAEQVAMAASRLSGDIVLPPITHGYNEKELTFAGTTSLPAEVFLTVVSGIGRSLQRSGWTRMVIVNGHGWNNDIIRTATHVLNEQNDFHVACCSYWSLCASEVAELRESPVPGGMAHGCEFETSLMLHLRPDSVQMAKAKDEISYRRMRHLHHDLLVKSAMFMPEQFDEMSESGVIGCPSFATAEKGRIWFEAATRRLAEFLEDFRAAFPGRKDVVPNLAVSRL